MSRHHRRQNFSPSCPSGGKFYACGSGSLFVGCCRGDPCEIGCATGNLEPASFDPAFYHKFPDEECSSGSSWYTCSKIDPPFMGCCKLSYDCSPGGCPAGDLTAGFLSSNPKLAAPFLSAVGSSLSLPPSSSSTATKSTSAMPADQSSASPTFTQSTTVTIASISATNSAQEPLQNATSKQSNNSGTVAGGVVGGIAAIVLIIIAFLIYRHKKPAAPSEVQMQETQIPESLDDKVGSKGSNDSQAQGTRLLSVKNALHAYLLHLLDSSYPTPIPAYSPSKHQPQSPPRYLRISELHSPSTTFQQFPQSPNQPIELPSPDVTSSPISHLRSGASTDGIGIAITPPPSHTAPAHEAYSTHSYTAAEGSRETNSTSAACQPGYQRASAGTEGRSELSASDSVRVKKKPSGGGTTLS